MANGEHADDVRTELSENDGFCTLQVRAKRGDGTRDQDRVTATLGRDTLDEIEADRERFLSMVEDTVERTRAMQPDDGDEDENGDEGDA